MIGGMGDEPGNLGNLPMGRIEAVIGSPPFVDSVGSDDPDKRGGGVYTHPQRDDGDTLRLGQSSKGGYGSAPGQLGAMKAGVAVVGSPPFENSMGLDDNAKHRQWWAERREASGRNPDANGGTPDTYGSTAGQIGATQGDTFWAAARLIVEQCALILPPNGVAIWVVKNYIKAGREVDFTGQWQALCEACGFETVHIHRAMLVKHQGVKQGAMEGESVSKEVSHKSFFRRLSERRGSPPIDYETILCTRKAA